MVYSPVMTSGYAVTLSDGVKEHTVHVAGERAVICSNADAAKVQSGVTVSSPRKAADAVRAAIAARLKIPATRVEVSSTRPAPLATPPCAAAPPEPTGAAFVIEARASGQMFRYYTDEAVTIDCGGPKTK
jgi:hypothetical protein